MSTWEEERAALDARDARRRDTIGRYHAGFPVTADLAAAIAAECGRPDLAERLGQGPIETTPEGHRTVTLTLALRPDTREIAITRWTGPTVTVWHVEDVTVDRYEASAWIDVWITDVDPATPEGVLALSTTAPTGVEL